MAKAISRNGVVLVELLVGPKPTVPDPRRRVLLSTLEDRGCNQVIDAMEGKYFELRFNGLTVKQARQLAKELANKMLANKVIETFRIHKAKRIPKI